MASMTASLSDLIFHTPWSNTGDTPHPILALIITWIATWQIPSPISKLYSDFDLLKDHLSWWLYLCSQSLISVPSASIVPYFTLFKNVSKHWQNSSRVSYMLLFLFSLLFAYYFPLQNINSSGLGVFIWFSHWLCPKGLRHRSVRVNWYKADQ